MSFEIFKNILFDNISLLLNLSKESPDNIISVKNNYNRQKNFLLENLNFLIKINLIQIESNKIKSKDIDLNNLSEVLLDYILKEPEYASCLKNYLRNFNFNKQDLCTFKPSRSYNYESSDLRDFLITLGYVKNSGEEFILIKPEILERIKNLKLSPEELEKKLLSQKLLGLNAEKLIFENELSILKELGIAKSPVHVALEDVSAGYDILSYRKEGELIKEIYIEVKAVSLSNYQFHLSTSEYQTSLKLNPNYFIYLLPVDYSLQEGFDLKNLLKISNIKENIFENKIEWSVGSDGYLITKN